jgi:hypothetical protein
VIELKLGKFKPEHKGQIELYLRYLEKNEMKAGDNPPIGLILCADKSQEIAELMMLEKDRIKVADYWTQLPPKRLLEEKLHSAIAEAKQEGVEEVSQESSISLTAGSNALAEPMELTQQKILETCKSEWKSCKQILAALGISRTASFNKNMKALLEKRLVVYLYAESPRNRYQKYKAVSG